jgi:ribosomal protein S18 acetylase RimI-like enzyme
MVSIHSLTSLTLADLQRIITGYVAQERYAVTWAETATGVHWGLERQSLAQPYVKVYDDLDAETCERYQEMLPLGYSLAVSIDEELAGLTIAEPHWWNRSLWVHEFHVAQAHRGQGIGRALMAVLAERATVGGLRTIVCETQNTNAPAIHFYRTVGFRLEGIDLSYYSNHDFPDGEVAIFLKRRLCP